MSQELKLRVCALCGAHSSTGLCSEDCKWDADPERPDSSYVLKVYEYVRTEPFTVEEWS